MLHQGVPDWIRGEPTKKFIDEFAKAASTGTRGMLPVEAMKTFLYQMTRYLNGNDYVSGMEIEDLGESHWSVRFIRTMGLFFGTALPRYVPLGEAALFHWNTNRVRSALRKWGTPTGHGAGSGEQQTAVPA